MTRPRLQVFFYSVISISRHHQKRRSSALVDLHTLEKNLEFPEVQGRAYFPIEFPAPILNYHSGHNVQEIEKESAPYRTSGNLMNVRTAKGQSTILQLYCVRKFNIFSQ